MINALGQPCPIPVVRAKQAVAALPPDGGVVEILVDNATACENLAKMAKGLGHGCESQKQPDGNFLVTISAGEGKRADATLPVPEAVPAASEKRGLVAVIGSDSMGRGSGELGKILLKGFIFSLSQMTPVPSAALFFNAGVRLACGGANTVADLRELAAKGCRVLVCGTCVDYYQCRDDIAVGEIVTMYDIVEAMGSGGSCVSV